MNKPLSKQAFIISLTLIFFSGLSFIGFLYYLTNIPISAPLPTYGLTSQPVTEQPQSVVLNLSHPENNLLVFNSNILVQGKTSPTAHILLSLGDDDQTLNLGENGNFSTTIQLKNGLNYLDVTAFDSFGNSKTESRLIYYSTEKI